jgi:hypothetical protein
MEGFGNELARADKSLDEAIKKKLDEKRSLNNQALSAFQI